MISRTIKQTSDVLSNEDFEALSKLAHRFSKSVNYFSTRFASPDCYGDLKYHRERLKPQIVGSKVVNELGLPARIWKLALDEAVSGLKGLWSNAKNDVRQAVYKNEKLQDEEKHYIMYILCWDSILEDIMCFRKHTIPSEFSSLNTKRLDSLIRHYMRKYRGKTPYRTKERSILLDSGTYRQKGDIIFVSSLEKHKRISIPMKSNIRIEGSIRLILRDDGSVEIHRCVKDKPLSNKSKTVIGVDKGYGCMLATNTDHLYGEKLGKLLTAESDRLAEKNAKRNQYYAMVRTLRESGDNAKADRIEKNNLGKVKYSRQKRRAESTIQSYINHEMKRFYDVEKPKEVVEENLDFTYTKDDRGKKYNRRMASWCKGTIKKSLERNAEKRCVKITKVNAAYTSQQCSKCGCLGERKGKTFTCKCGNRMDADINAAKNILSRKGDTEITLFTNYNRVRDILIARQS